MSSLPALFLLALAGAGAPAAVARVDGDVITAPEVMDRLALMRSRGVSAQPKDALENLIGEAVLAADARKRGILAQAAVREQLEQARRQAVVEAFLQKQVAAGIKPSDQELREAFHVTADSLRLTLLIFTGEAAAKAAADRAARSGALDLELPGAVRGASAGPDGDTGLRIRGQFDPALAAAAMKAPPGAVTGPVQLPLGWAVFKVLERHEGSEAEFQARRPEVERNVRAQAVEAARRHLVQMLRKTSNVAIDERFLEALGKRVEPTEAEGEHVVATLGGRPLRYRDLVDSIRSVAGAGSGHLGGPAIKKQVAWSAVDVRLLQEEALARGFGADPSVAERIPGIERHALVEAVVKQLEASARNATDAEVRDLYQANRARLGVPIEAARDQLARASKQQRVAAALDAKVRELRLRAAVQIDQPALDRLTAGAK